MRYWADAWSAVHQSPPPILLPDRLICRFPTTESYLVGVSGGRDSVTLLHLLVNLGYARLIVCHLDHQLRGRASSADARLVERLARYYGLRYVIGAADVRDLAAQSKMSVETAARTARYTFFAGVAKRRRSPTIFLAHHADDVVETFLMNLFRGAGTTGLASIRELSRQQVGGADLQVVRPLLYSWRRDIDHCVRRYRLQFREDASNEQLGPLRNRIRRRIIPYLEKTVGRDIRQNIWRTAMIAAEEESFFSGLTDDTGLTSESLTLAPLREMAVALQRRTLHKWLRAADVVNVGFDLIERVRELLDPAARIARTNLPGDRHVRRRAGKLFIE